MHHNHVRGMVEKIAFDRLEMYVSLLAKWRKITNLISEDGFADVWRRHILDGIFLQQQRPGAKSWVDIGSGAGFPAAVIAILIADTQGSQVHCVEIDRRKCSFLREVAGKLNVPMKIHNVLAQNLDSTEILGVEVVTARAFAKIEKILELTQPFLAGGATAILPRGHETWDEVAEIPRDRYTVNVLANPSPGDGFFVHVDVRAANFVCTMAKPS